MKIGGFEHNEAELGRPMNSFLYNPHQFNIPYGLLNVYGGRCEL